MVGHHHGKIGAVKASTGSLDKPSMCLALFSIRKIQKYDQFLVNKIKKGGKG